MSTKEKDNIEYKSPKNIFWVGGLAKSCLSMAQRKFRSEQETHIIAKYDGTEHNQHKQIFAKELRVQGNLVITERKIISRYNDIYVGAYVDVYSKKKSTGKESVYEVKPLNQSWYDDQHKFTMVLMHDLNIKADYYIYEYKTGKIIPKILDDVDLARDNMLYKIDIITSSLDTLPEPSPYCRFCKYTQCPEHPFHDEYKKKSSGGIV